MSKVIITDTSCIILLDKIGELDLLHQLYGQVYITSVIADEYGQELPDYFIIEDAGNKALVNLLVKENRLDIGESTAIALALEKSDSILVIDEYKGRKVAKSLDIKVIGTIGILINSKKNGLISNIKPYLEKLEQNHFRISQEILSQALQECGEG